jgi:hypothetical protein
MGNLVHFYSKNVGWRDDVAGPGKTGANRAAQTSAMGYKIDDFASFTATLRSLKSAGTKIDRWVIETHGSPGAMYFGTDPVTWSQISGLASDGFDEMFESNARIFLNGCNIAESECSTGTCGPAGNGRKFLLEMAKVFLRKNGGRVGASTSKGLALGAFLPGNKIYHLWGETVYVLISPGGLKTRIVAGQELETPLGQWKVTLDDGSMEFYRFYTDGKAAWDDGSLIGGDSGSGTWSTSAGKLLIAWNSGGREAWDMPLYTKEQAGVWTTAAGLSSDIKAEKIIDSGRIID